MLRFEFGAFMALLGFAIAIWIDWDRFRNWPRDLQIGFYIVPPQNRESP